VLLGCEGCEGGLELDDEELEEEEDEELELELEELGELEEDDD